VLTAALFMDAKWARPFDPANTSSGTFATAPGRTVTARYMNGGSFPVATAGGWTAVTLPYAGGTLAMTALLPPAGAGECALPGSSLLRSLTGAAGRARAAVSLPKVSLSTAGSLNTVLATLGMGVAFDPATADFTGLSPAAGFLKFVRQAAALRVGEKGTVGAAAAAAGIEPTAGIAGPPPVVFDRPYLLLVRGAAGEPLFLAKVANPDAS
jgi:serpin B